MSGSPEIRPHHWAKPRREPEPFTPDKCGTRAGYKRHLRHGIEPCAPCRASNTQHCAEGRHKRERVTA